jgi:hypothetical protein
MQAVEHYLGSIEKWPVYIINYLIVDTTTPAVIEALTAFFAGNGVPETLAYKLYRACNPQQQTSSCASYSTHVIHAGTHPTPFDASPSIMM